MFNFIIKDLIFDIEIKTHKYPVPNFIFKNLYMSFRILKYILVLILNHHVLTPTQANVQYMHFPTN